MKVEVFDLMQGVKEARFVVQHESCNCKCRLNKTVYNSKQNLYFCVNVGDDWSSGKEVLCGILENVIVGVIRHLKLMNTQILKIFMWKMYNVKKL